MRIGLFGVYLGMKVEFGETFLCESYLFSEKFNFYEYKSFEASVSLSYLVLTNGFKRREHVSTRIHTLSMTMKNFFS